MTKTEFFEIHGGGLVVAELDSTADGDFLFLHPEEISKVQEFDTNEYQVVSVHETEDGEDIVMQNSQSSTVILKQSYSRL